MKQFENKKIVCIGGGVGTANLLKGLKQYANNIAVILSMADDGGSGGRLRRAYNIPPPGDFVSCMTGLSASDNDQIAHLLTYRFPGNRYAKDTVLAGHKLGNLILVAMRDITGNFESAIELFQKTFAITGKFLPATKEAVTISAHTVDGKIIEGEEKIDLGKYTGKRVLDRVYLHPEHATATKEALLAIKQADVIIVGPGDLYTTILPSIIVPGIEQALSQSRAKKFLVINVANKPFETKGYFVQDFITVIIKHINSFPFNHIVTNNNYAVKIPEQFKYHYVKINPQDKKDTPYTNRIISADLVNDDFPLYHSPEKLARVLAKHI